MLFDFFQHECLGRLRLKCADHIEKEKGEIIANIFNIDPDKPKKLCKIVIIFLFIMERSGSVVECLTRDRGVRVQASPVSLRCGP